MWIVLAILVAVALIVILSALNNRLGSVPQQAEERTAGGAANQRLESIFELTEIHGQKPTKYEVEVVGESYRNSDGSDRQRIIARLQVGDPIVLVREPDNQYDSNAIAVCTTGGRQIGYLSRADAQRFSAKMDKGVVLKAVIRFIGGGTANKPSRGVWLNVYAIRKPQPRKAVRTANRSGA